MNRRTLLSSGLAYGATSTVFPALTRQLSAQTIPPANSAPVVSKSLLLLVQKKALPFFRKQQSDALAATGISAGDLQSFTTSVEAFFGNLQDSGWNAWFTKQVAAQEASILASSVSSYVTDIVQGFENEGINLTASELQELHAAFDSAIINLKSTLDQVIGSGLNTIEQNILSQLSGLAGSGLQPENRIAENIALICDGIALGSWAVGQGEIGIPFGAVGFIVGALNANGFFGD